MNGHPRKRGIEDPGGYDQKTPQPITVNVEKPLSKETICKVCKGEIPTRMQSQEQKNIDLFSATLIARNPSEDQKHE